MNTKLIGVVLVAALMLVPASAVATQSAASGPDDDGCEEKPYDEELVCEVRDILPTFEWIEHPS